MSLPRSVNRTSPPLLTACPYHDVDGFTYSHITDLAHGSECVYKAPGFECESSQCINGSWTTLYPQCNPNTCWFSDYHIPNGATSNCTINTTPASGTICAFSYMGHTCNTIECYAGEWLSDGECVPNECIYTELTTPPVPETDAALLLNDGTDFTRSSWNPVSSCNPNAHGKIQHGDIKMY